MIIRVDGDRSYFIDRSTYKKLSMYDPRNRNLEFVTRLEDGVSLHIESSKIRPTKLGICFDHDGKTHVIDDNYQQVLSYAAYIINDRFINRIEYNNERGMAARKQISRLIGETIEEHEFSNCYFSETTRSLNITSQCRFKYNIGGKIIFQTVSNLVNQNKTRREFDLPYLPYIRGIDKYNSYYMSIWVNEVGGQFGGESFEFDIFLSDLIAELNNKEGSELTFKAIKVPITNRVIRVRDDLSSRE